MCYIINFAGKFFNQSGVFIFAENLSNGLLRCGSNSHSHCKIIKEYNLVSLSQKQ